MRIISGILGILNTVQDVFIFDYLGFYVSLEKIFHSSGDVTITGRGMKILTYARHLRPLSSEVSLACHTYFDTGHPFPRTLDTHTYCRAFGSGAVTTWSVAAGIRTHRSPLAGRTL